MPIHELLSLYGYGAGSPADEDEEEEEEPEEEEDDEEEDEEEDPDNDESSRSTGELKRNEVTIMLLFEFLDSDMYSLNCKQQTSKTVCLILSAEEGELVLKCQLTE